MRTTLKNTLLLAVLATATFETADQLNASSRVRNAKDQVRPAASPSTK